MSLKFVPQGPINNIPALVQIVAWCRTSHYLKQWLALVYWCIWSVRLSTPSFFDYLKKQWLISPQTWYLCLLVESSIFRNDLIQGHVAAFLAHLWPKNNNKWEKLLLFLFQQIGGTLLSNFVYSIIAQVSKRFQSVPIRTPLWPRNVLKCVANHLLCYQLWQCSLEKWLIMKNLRLQGVQRSGKSQGNSRLGKSQGKVREFCWRSGKKWILGKVREFAFSAI